MPFLIIISALALLFVWLLNLHINLSFVNNGERTVYVKIFFFRYHIAGEKEKRIKVRKFKTKRFRKALKKRRAKLEKSKKDTSATPVKKTKKSEKRLDFESIKKILGSGFPIFYKKGEIKVKKLIVGVATDDPYKTAIEYGLVVQSVQYFILFLQRNTKVSEQRGAKISVYPDFTTDKYIFEIDVKLRIKIWHLVVFIIKHIIGSIKSGNQKKNSVKKQKIKKAA